MASSARVFPAASFAAVALAFTLGAACSSTNASPTTLSDGGHVLPAYCMDGKKDNDETDLDCGGPSCAKCTGNKACSAGTDCSSTVCQTNGTCTFPTATDGVKNGNETDVDCGGGENAPACGDGKGCGTGSDCVSQVCGASKTCSAASPTDGLKNGGETDVDCGSSGALAGAGTAVVSDHAPACAQGKACGVNGDCVTNGCAPSTHTCVPTSAVDGFKDGDETDVDCGGTSGAAPCPAGDACKVTTDCASLVCKNLVCARATSADSVINEGETDVDCGGPLAPGCGNGKLCKQHADCSSNGCDDSGHCALGISCTQAHGGYSCGSGETGDATATHESCCTALPVTGVNGGDFLLDKYVITAGRMRQFVVRNNGNIRGWVQAHYPPGWNTGWDDWLPSNYSGDAQDAYPGGVYAQLGPKPYGTVQGGNEGCFVTGSGTANGARSYRLPDNINLQNWSDQQNYTQDQEDEKAINCVTVFMLMAFCAWDGGALATQAQLEYAWFGGNSSRTYPWGATPQPAGYPTAYPNAQSAHDPNPANGDVTITNYFQNYWYPSDQIGADYTIFISAPGRFPRNAGPFGHMDLAGLAMEITSTVTSASTDPTKQTVKWSRAGSWQGHLPGDNQYQFPMTNKYLAATGRCAR